MTRFWTRSCTRCVISVGQARRACTLAREYKLSAYDASYLDVAIRGGAELATADEGLEKAGRAAGVPIMMSPRTGKGRR